MLITGTSRIHDAHLKGINVVSIDTMLLPLILLLSSLHHAVGIVVDVNVFVNEVEIRNRGRD